MSLFGNLSTEGMEESGDRLGGGFQPLETDIYTGKIKLAYAGASAGGARFVALVVDLNGKEYRETIYVTNKKGENWFLNKDDRTKKVALPGFTTMDHVCLVATGKALADQDAEEKVVNIYDFDAKKEMPTKVPVLIDLLGKTVSLGITKTTENKSVKDGNGVYQPTAETREVNAIDKVFDTETKLTVAEATQGLAEGAFWGSWVERNRHITRDKRTIKDGAGGAAGRPAPRAAAGGPPVAGGGTAPKKSLFGTKG